MGDALCREKDHRAGHAEPALRRQTLHDVFERHAQVCLLRQELADLANQRQLARLFVRGTRLRINPLCRR